MVNALSKSAIISFISDRDDMGNNKKT